MSHGVWRLCVMRVYSKTGVAVRVMSQGAPSWHSKFRLLSLPPSNTVSCVLQFHHSTLHSSTSRKSSKCRTSLLTSSSTTTFSTSLHPGPKVHRRSSPPGKSDPLLSFPQKSLPNLRRQSLPLPKPESQNFLNPLRPRKLQRLSQLPASPTAEPARPLYLGAHRSFQQRRQQTPRRPQSLTTRLRKLLLKPTKSSKNRLIHAPLSAVLGSDHPHILYHKFDHKNGFHNKRDIGLRQWHHIQCHLNRWILRRRCCRRRRQWYQRRRVEH